MAAACDLAVFTSLISVHEEPFHCSTLVVEPFGGSINPDIHKAAVLVPVPEVKVLLVWFKSFTSVQLDPSQFSVTP